jgi:hypothetical protein
VSLGKEAPHLRFVKHTVQRGIMGQQGALAWLLSHLGDSLDVKVIKYGSIDTGYGHVAKNRNKVVVNDSDIALKRDSTFSAIELLLHPLDGKLRNVAETPCYDRQILFETDLSLDQQPLCFDYCFL